MFWILANLQAPRLGPCNLLREGVRTYEEHERTDPVTTGVGDAPLAQYGCMVYWGRYAN